MPPGRESARGSRPSSSSAEDSQLSPQAVLEKKGNVEAAIDSVAEKVKDHTVSTLVERLKALADLWEVSLRACAGAPCEISTL